MSLMCVCVFFFFFASRRNGSALLFHPDRRGKLLITISIQNPGSQDARLTDLDLLKGFRGSGGGRRGGGGGWGGIFDPPGAREDFSQ